MIISELSNAELLKMRERYVMESRFQTPILLIEEIIRLRAALANANWQGDRYNAKRAQFESECG